MRQGGILIRRFRMFFALALSLTVLFVGCAGEPRSAEDMLLEICVSLSMPAGRVYFRAAEEGSENFLPVDTTEVMYGEDAEEIFALVEDFAIYVSEIASPREVAVFRCYSSSDTDSVAAICLERVDMIRVLLKDGGASELAQGAQVTVRGHYVVMIVTGDAEAAEDAIRSAFK